MSLSARLYIGDNHSSDYAKEYQVVCCRIRVARSHNSYMPDSDPRCKEVHLSVIVPEKDDLGLYEWYIDQSSQSGKLVIDLSNQAAKYDITERTFKFKEAKCFSVAETYDMESPYRHLLEVGLMMPDLEIDDTIFSIKNL